ncbi:DUF6760 family protein [Microlunatus ginsengisoli]|uniref:DUF6760 family protein n=1 Tax=Microlunatus ginsengisoli TaxID=363863 RepID=UPI0031DDE240
MPLLRPPLRGGRLRGAPGGILTYATDRLYEEIAYVAYYLHWTREEILDLEHAERQRFVREIGALNSRISGD